MLKNVSDRNVSQIQYWKDKNLPNYYFFRNPIASKRNGSQNALYDLKLMYFEPGKAFTAIIFKSDCQTYIQSH